MQVEFWGVRGSIACGGPDYAIYGGNTSCVAIQARDHRLIIDAGTGIRRLGDKLAGARVRDFHLMLSHTHFDHVCGFPFFAPAYDPHVTMTIWSGHLGGGDGATRRVMSRLMEAPLFPVDPAIFKAAVNYHDFSPGAVLSPYPGVTVRTCALNHPNGATAYRIEADGESVVYASDHEHGDAAADTRLIGFAAHADLLIYDATYTDASYPAHQNWGHSTWQQGLRIALAAKVRSLALFHHDPSHDDKTLSAIEIDARAAGSAAGIPVFAAREGDVWTA